MVTTLSWRFPRLSFPLLLLQRKDHTKKIREENACSGHVVNFTDTSNMRYITAPWCCLTSFLGRPVKVISNVYITNGQFDRAWLDCSFQTKWGAREHTTWHHVLKAEHRPPLFLCDAFAVKSCTRTDFFFFLNAVSQCHISFIGSIGTWTYIANKAHSMLKMTAQVTDLIVKSICQCRMIADISFAYIFFIFPRPHIWMQKKDH